MKEAESTIKESNLQFVINNEQKNMDKENIVVKQQTPKAGVKVKEKSSVYIDY